MRKIRKIRTHVSYITNEKCDAYRKASISVQPLNKPICDKSDTHNVIIRGSKAMKRDGFILMRGIKNV